MAKAAAWPSLTFPLVRPSMKRAMSCGERRKPSRFARMISCGRKEALLIAAFRSASAMQVEAMLHQRRPGALGVLGEAKEREFRKRHHAVIDERVERHHLAPIGFV